MAKTQTCNELKQRIKDLEKERAEWQRSEQTLRERERRYRTMFDHSYQFIGLMTPDGTGLEINKTAVTFMGIEESDVFGKPYWEIPFWNQSKELQEQLREAVKTAAEGQIVRFEVTHTAADGTLKYIDFSLIPVKDETGQVVLLIPEGRDITDLKLAEQALRQSENTARALLNAPTDIFLLHDSQGVVLAANTVAAERLCKGVDELVGKNVFDLSLAPVFQSRMMRVRQVIESKMPVRWEDEFQGETYDHHLYPILDAQGEVAQIAVYVRDVTDYKQAVTLLEERTTDLLNSEEKYRTLVENIPIVVYRMGPTGETNFVNCVVEDIFGYRSGEIMGSPDLWYEKVYQEDRPRVEELRRRSFQEGEEFVAEYRVTHKDGYITYVMDHAIPVRLANGLIGSVDGFIMDVTGMVKLQERLVRAEEIKTISEVSARLAHEIRNPLVSVGGFARRIFSAMSPDDPNRTRVEIIVQEVGRMETILQMMLSYIQPLDLNMSFVDPNSLVRGVLKELDRGIREREVKMDLQLAPSTPQIYVDRQRIERALEALIKNALSQIPEGGTLSISSSSEGRNFDLIIQYPVTSMSHDDVEHFFYPFTWSRVISEIADLPLSKILVNKLGGSIEVSLNQLGELILHVSLPC